MSRVAAVLASLATVSAFVPSGRVSSSALKMGFETEAGVSLPTGYFDPLGLATDKETFDRYRVSELKHGRAAQLAVIGYVVPEIFRFPGDVSPGISFSSVPNGIAAINAIPALGWFQIVFLIGAVDYYGILILGDTTGKGKSPAELAVLKTKELNNGRLAMFAILELLRHDAEKLVGGAYAGDNLITGLPFLY